MTTREAQDAQSRHGSIDKVDSVTAGAARDRADWDRVAHVYRQCVEALGDETQPYLPPTLAGFLAEVLARVSASYFGHEDQLVQDALEIFCEADRLSPGVESFQRLYSDPRFFRLQAYSTPMDGVRRRPTPFEATVETARRLRDLNSIEEAIRSVTVGAVLGGSASYGRFYNIVGHQNGTKSASDLDLLFIAGDYSSLVNLCKQLENVPSVDRSELEDLARRAGQFLDEHVPESARPVVFSGKVGMWSSMQDPIFRESGLKSRYDVSIHVCTEEIFRSIILRDFPRISLEVIGKSLQVNDFRENLISRKDHQRNLGGGNLRLELETRPLGDSFLRSSYVFYIDSRNQYYPGMFQNLVLPNFDLRWGTTELRRSIEAFRWKIVERLRFEGRARPHDFLRISLAHTRSEVFAPHTVRSVDRSTLLP